MSHNAELGRFCRAIERTEAWHPYAACLDAAEHPWVKTYVWMCRSFPTEEPNEYVTDDDWCYVVVCNPGLRSVFVTVRCQMLGGKLVYIVDPVGPMFEIELVAPPVTQSEEIFVDHAVQVRVTTSPRGADVKHVVARVRFQRQESAGNPRTRELTLRFR